MSFDAFLAILIFLRCRHHNRWAKGICDTGDATNSPLEHNNLTGLNQIIGVTDTGIDMFK